MFGGFSWVVVETPVQVSTWAHEQQRYNDVRFVAHSERSTVTIDPLAVLFELFVPEFMPWWKTLEVFRRSLEHYPNTTRFRIFQGARATFRQNVCVGNKNILQLLVEKKDSACTHCELRES